MATGDAAALVDGVETGAGAAVQLDAEKLCRTILDVGNANQDGVVGLLVFGPCPRSAENKRKHTEQKQSRSSLHGTSPRVQNTS